MSAGVIMKALRRHRLVERAPLRDELEHRAREALDGVLDEERRGGPVDVGLLREALVGEIGDRDLGLLEGELEEDLHLRRVLGHRHPLVDQRLQLRRVGRDRRHVGARGGEPHEEVLHLRHVHGRRDRRKGRGPRRQPRSRRPSTAPRGAPPLHAAPLASAAAVRLERRTRVGRVGRDTGASCVHGWSEQAPYRCHRSP